MSEVITPSSTSDVSAALRSAWHDGLRVLPRGAGTKLDWGAPPSGVDVEVDMRGLDRIVEYAPGDLVVRVEAGVPLAALSEHCAPAGQMLALDPIVPGGTVGGTVATNASGPGRYRYGTCRDLLIGVTVVLADGTVARSGGKVVKNVAGYDLGKLYTGSYGTLGVVTEAVFRLHPLPVGRAYVSVVAEGPAEAAAAAERVRRSQLAVSAIEVDRPDPTGPLTVTALVDGAGAEGEPRPPPWWGTAPWPAGGTGLKVSARLSRLGAVLDLLGRPGVTVRGSLGAGVLYAGMPADTPVEAVAGLVADLRAALAPGEGSAVVVCTPVSDGLDRWGPVLGLELMRRVKARFDPRGLLNPGRFVGGI